MLDEARQFAGSMCVLNLLVSAPACLFVSDWYASLELQDEADSGVHPKSPIAIIPSGLKRIGAL